MKIKLHFKFDERRNEWPYLRKTTRHIVKSYRNSYRSFSINSNQYIYRLTYELLRNNYFIDYLNI